MALEGKLVRLREERESDLQLFVDLRNDLDTQGWSKTLPPDYTLPMYRKRFEEREFSFDRFDGRFTIELIESGEVIGYLGYYGLEPRFSVTVGISIAKEFWSAGLAYDAQEVLLAFLFEELGVRTVRLWTTSGNSKAVSLAERSGFKVAMRQRESICKNGKLYDNLLMDLLREEYYEAHPQLTDHVPGI